MHVIFIVAGLASAIGFVFGETAARVFIGAVLALISLAALGIISIAIVDINR